MMENGRELSSLTRPELKERWQEILGSEPAPRVRNATMVRILTCELQWKASGENRAAVLRKLRKAAGEPETATKSAGKGTRLIREWNGKRYTVDVTSDGYVWRSKTWRSLSAIAKEITGVKWSGPRFFGVKS